MSWRVALDAAGMRTEISIFYRGSRTFFVSSLFFPRKQRTDVFKLYSFLRLVDDYVDQPVPEKEKFNKIRAIWDEAVKSPDFYVTPHRNDPVDLRVIKNILKLTRKYDFDPVWIEAFFSSMEADIKGKKYQTLDETLEYVYGSAEVVGLMMARIMGLPSQADEFARLQGRAFQWINFIRDIAEDNKFGRQYFPTDDLERFKLKDLSQRIAPEQPDDFSDFIHFQIKRYKKWQAEAEKGYKYIPKLQRIALQTARDMYIWTALQVHKKPRRVFVEQAKPSPGRIGYTILTNMF
jgi:phytoene synthase